jgi:hypothetical protein
VPVRLIGVALSKLSLDDVQLDLPRLDGGVVRGRAVDAVREKFGYDAMHLATTLEHAGGRLGRRPTRSFGDW